MPEEVRRFVHKNGFRDDVAWIEYYRNRDLMFVLDDGNKIKASCYSLSGMENLVSDGDWIELKPFTIYEFSSQQIFQNKKKPFVYMKLKEPTKRNTTRW